MAAFAASAKDCDVISSSFLSYEFSFVPALWMMAFPEREPKQREMFFILPPNLGR